MNANTNPKYEKLKNLLKELFQLDQPDLDFGIYRIMHARSEEITKFLDNDLLPQVKQAFSQYQSADKKEIQKQLDETITQAKNLGIDPEASPKVKELRTQLASAAVDTDALESEVYDHLYRFFRRYYSDGDFISKRVYKEGVYAIPYEGEEVKLYWANYDQYYIKTSEYLRDYAFRLKPNDDKNPLRVHFRLVDASEGEHNNVKEAEGKNRVFVLTGDNFISLENGELVINFEFRPATLSDWPEAERAGKQKPPTQKELIAIAEKRILALQDEKLQPWLTELKKPQIKADGIAADYSRIVAHLNRYTARNTFDYFIHKDLGGFLNRELDFYIKNEVMHLDDIENESAPRVEQYLSKIKVIRSIAKKIIDFLAQLENFQKKLWLKKKFVVETNYCLTLDRVPEEFYPEIAANKAQIEEWIKLFAIDEIKPTAGDLLSAGKPGYSVPLTVEFLKAHNKLVLDTRFFSEDFKAKLIASIDHFDEQMDGLLIHSENFQALNLLQARYKEQVKCVYIDPPYNTEQDRTEGKFLYKDGYDHSSWISMMYDRGIISRNYLNKNGVFFFSIDEEEASRSWELFKQIYGQLNFSTDFVWEKKKKPSFLHRNIGKLNDYIFAFTKDYTATFPFSIESTTEGKMTPLNNAGNTLSILEFPPNTVRFNIPDGIIEPQDMSEGNIKTKLLDRLVIENGRNKNAFRLEGEWRYSQAKLNEIIEEKGELYISKIPFRPNHIKKGGDIKKMKNILSPHHYQMETNEDASQQIFDLFNKESFKNPKPEKLIRTLIKAVTYDISDNQVILDYFAGSGTTAHAVINLNREDGGKRKYILVEMADYFDTVLKPRIQKVIYSAEWKDGKPTSRDTGISHCFKYIRLESYEDTLNNLELCRTQSQADLFASAGEGAKSFKEDYILHYMLDVESRGSVSLLNTEAFMDPTAYKLKVKIPGSDESRIVAVDLIETFNYLLGLQVEHIAAPQRISATFERDSEQRLRIKGRLTEKADGPWWFRTVTGTTLDGRKILVIWRNRPGGEITEGVEKDNLVLDEWFKKMGYSSKDREFDLIYVNGTNNLENLKTPDDQWKVRLIEEDFKRLMFEETGV